MKKYSIFFAFVFICSVISFCGYAIGQIGDSTDTNNGSSTETNDGNEETFVNERHNYQFTYDTSILAIKGTSMNGEPIFVSDHIAVTIYADGREVVDLDGYEGLKKKETIKKAYNEDYNVAKVNEGVEIVEYEKTSNSFSIKYSTLEFQDKIFDKKIIMSNGQLIVLMIEIPVKMDASFLPYIENMKDSFKEIKN